MDLKGARVVRGWVVTDGPDGGSGHLGTIVSMDKDNVLVLFDDGKAKTYPPATPDIFIYDLGPTGFDHSSVTCDGCSTCPLMGIRWKCTVCQNFDLCTQCYHGGVHDLGHAFCRIFLDHYKPVLVSSRKSCDQSNQLRGFFRGAKVIRGKDWEWGAQDGGSGRTGMILNLYDWQLNGRAYPRSGVRVKWDDSFVSNTYRTGFKGKVDLICIEPTVGGRYFKEHLPSLGSLTQETRVPRERMDRKFQVGDLVTPNVVRDEMVRLQDGHGGYAENMARLIGRVGRVVGVFAWGVTVEFSVGLSGRDLGDVFIRLLLGNENPERSWAFNTACLKKVEDMAVGSKVRITSNKVLFRAAQENCDAWTDGLDAVCGREATVLVQFDGRLVTVIFAKELVLKLSVAVIEEPEDLTNALLEDMLVRFIDALRPSLEVDAPAAPVQPSVKPVQKDVGEELMALVVDGQSERFKDLLVNNKHLLNKVIRGKTLLHVAAMQGNSAIVKLLLDERAEVNLADEDGYTALHFAANQDKDAVGRMLLRRGALMDAQTKKGFTALHLAVYRQCDPFVRMLVHNECDVNVKDNDGDTALHVACSKESSVIGCCLLDSHGVDVTVVNRKGFNCVHQAALKGQNEVITKMVRKFPSAFNIAKEDGYAALHIAVVNGLEDIVCLLLQSKICDLEQKTKNGLTPLMLACVEGFLSLAKLLINFGASLDAEDKSGDTSLHLCIVKHLHMKNLPDELIDMEVYPSVESVKNQFASPVASGIVIACYLIDKGASVDYLNNEGKSPVDVCEDQNLKSLLFEFSKKAIDSHAKTAPAQSANPARSQAPAFEKCQFCEQPVQSRFQPCGHAILCDRHAKFMKVCPQCETFVESVTSIQQAPKCIICRDLTASVTFRPCGHSIACGQCALRFRNCLTCDAPIASKEGLGPSGQGSASAGAQLSDTDENEQNLCIICYERRRNCVFLCGHGACKTCAHALQLCHICRAPIERIIVMFD